MQEAEENFFFFKAPFEFKTMCQYAALIKCQYKDRVHFGVYNKFGF